MPNSKNFKMYDWCLFEFGCFDIVKRRDVVTDNLRNIAVDICINVDNCNLVTAFFEATYLQMPTSRIGSLLSTI